jgi:hypothetical protein
MLKMSNPHVAIEALKEEWAVCKNHKHKKAGLIEVCPPLTVSYVRPL